jgi:hypothetical protein
MQDFVIQRPWREKGQERVLRLGHSFITDEIEGTGSCHIGYAFSTSKKKSETDEDV